MSSKTDKKLEEIKNTKQKAIIDDVRTAIDTIPSDSIQLVVTSPPYWSIKDYKDPKQIGYRQPYPKYLSEMEWVWWETYRLISPGCKLVVNIGDQFLRANQNDGVYEIVPIHADTIRQCTGAGFIYLGSIIWRKITTTNPSGGGSWMGSGYYPRDGYITYEHEYIAIFKKPGDAPKSTAETRFMSKLTREERSKWFRGVWDDVHPVRQEGHCAMFPIELPRRIIKMFSFAGETVLDPFVGSGTTLEAAEECNRNGIGIEVNPMNMEMILKRVPDVDLDVRLKEYKRRK